MIVLRFVEVLSRIVAVFKTTGLVEVIGLRVVHGVHRAYRALSGFRFSGL